MFADGIISALSISARIHAGLELTVVASLGSQIDLPLVTINPQEFDESDSSLESLLHQALVMAGGWQGYDIVHCMARAPGAAQLHLGGGGRLLYTPPCEGNSAVLKALPCLGTAETEDTSLPDSVRNALHPVCPTKVPLATGQDFRLFSASPQSVATSKYNWRLVESPADIAGRNPTVVIGPSGGTRFAHLVWAVRSLMSGAAYLHNCSDLAAPFWPPGGVIAFDHRRPLDDVIDSIRSDTGLPERLRRWALAYCAPAASAARLRRQYERICAAR